VDPNVTQALDPNRTQSIAGLNVTQTIQPVQCPVCKSFNPAGEAFCIECGLLFSSALPEDAFGAPAVRLPCLVEESGREHYLRAGSNTIGREGDVLLDDTRVSRRHAEVTISGDSISIRDLGSTNGTFVNDKQLTDEENVALAPGDKVALGGHVLTLSVPGDSGATRVLPEVSGETSESIAERIPAQFELVINEERRNLFEGENRAGRGPGNDVVLDDPYASGSHGMFECIGEDVFFTDVGSTNGSFLNGAKLSPGQRVKVTSDDELVLGQTPVRIEGL
jgi:pSer/pThr/pTyr-binding forkhead associated (FHA) protein